MSDRGEAYDDRTQWNETDSPFREAFGNVPGSEDYEWVFPPKISDEIRDSPPAPASEYGRAHPMIWKKDDLGKLMENGSDFVRAFRLTWKDAATLIYYANQCRVHSHFDDDGWVFYSGYELFTAGLIDEGARLTVRLSAKQRVQVFGKSALSKLDYQRFGLQRYADRLWQMIVKMIDSQNTPENHLGLAWRAARWRREVIDWLAEHGGIEIRSVRVGTIVLGHATREKEFNEIIMLAGGIIEQADPRQIREALAGTGDETSHRFLGLLDKHLPES
jgi:hypothetical protein